MDNNDSQRGSGYLGGITGYNSVTGAITDSATGRWFVYGDNISKASTIGGIVGTNISSKDLTTLVNCAAVRRYTRLSSKKNDDNTTNDILALRPRALRSMSAASSATRATTATTCGR